MADLITMLSAVAGQQGEEVDDDFNQTVLLLHGDGTNGAQNNTFLDSSTNNFTITRNGNTTQGTFSPFSVGAGEWSNYFDGTDDYLSVADNAVLRPGAGAFTLEAWIYRNVSGAAHTVYAKGGASTGIVLQVTSGNVLRFTHTTTNIDSTGTVAANAWVHVAVVREGTGTNQTKLYINGVQDGQGTVSTDFTQTEEVRIGTNRGATEDFAGYISNVRFVKGSALYTAGFTPSIVPLTTTSQGASSSEVELLTCQSNRFVDNSTNAFAITRNGDVRVTPFSPFAPTAAYSAGTNGGSGYFDGSGDYLDIADNAVLTPSGDFCIELWAYPTSSSGTQEWYSKGPGIQIYIAAGNWGIALSSNNTTTYYFSNNTKPVIANAWTHLAVTRSGNTYKWFVNGEEIATTTSSSAPGTGSNVVRIGGVTGANLYPAFGYIGGVRYVNGSPVYTSAFTPPTAPLTAITNTSLLCNFTNAGILDNTGKNNLETVGNAQIDTAVKKYGTGSMEFDGTGDWLQINSGSNDLFNFGTGNFTVECWFYRASTSGRSDLLGRYISTPAGWGIALSLTNAGDIVFYYGNTTIASTAGSTWSANTWTHVAVVRSGTSLVIYVNGVSSATATNSTDMSAGNPLQIGAGGASTQALNGFIDDLRITKGVARYTANFTAPTKAFPDQ